MQQAFQQTYQLQRFFYLFLCLLVPMASFATDHPILRIETGMHTARIWRIDVDAAERYLVTGSQDKTVRVWSLPDGQLIRVLRPPIDEGREGIIYAVAISPNGKTVAMGGWTGKIRNMSIYLFNRATGELRQRIKGLPNVIQHLAYSPDGRYLAANFWDKDGIRIYRTSDYRLQAQDTDYDDGSYWSEFDRHGRLVTSSSDGNIRLYDKSFQLIAKHQTFSGKPSLVRFSPWGDQIAVGFFDSTYINVLSGYDLKPLSSPKTQGVDNGNLSTIAWSQNGRWLYASGKYDDADIHPILRWSEANQGSYHVWSALSGTVMDIRALRNGRILFAGGGPAFGLLNASGQKILYRKASFWDIFDGDFLLSRNADIVQFAGKRPARFSLYDRTLMLNPTTSSNLTVPRTRDSEFTVTHWNNSSYPKLNGKPLLSPLKRYELSQCLAITPDSQYFLLGTIWYLRLFDKQGHQQWKVPVSGTVAGINIASNGKVAVAALADGTLRWYRLYDGQELLAFFLHKDGKRWHWILWTPQGYYVASPGGEKLMGWHINRGKDKAADFFPAARFRDYYYRPDVIDKVLETLDPDMALWLANKKKGVSPSKRGSIQELLPPVVALLSPEDGTDFSQSQNKLHYSVRSPSGEPITALNVLVDGRPLQTSQARGAKQINRPKATIQDPYLVAARLAEIGYLTKAINQIDIQDVKAALEEFQRDIGIAQTGQLDDNTWQKLSRVKLSRHKKTLLESINRTKDGLDGYLLQPSLARGGKRINRKKKNESGIELILRVSTSKNKEQVLRVSVPQRDLNVSLIAKNRFATSEPATVYLRWAGKNTTSRKVSISTDKPKLYVLAVGVSNYQNSSLNLAYAAKDARDFVTVLEKQSGKRYSNVKTKLLEDATRDDILNGLDWIERKTTRDDVAMVFFAGHGENDKNDRYYFLPSDTNKQQLRRTAIAYHEIKETLNTLTGKALFFIDTCHSGNVMGRRGIISHRRSVKGSRSSLPDVNRIVNDLTSAENGVVVFAASTGRQSSLENSLWENGAFTEALVEGLNGKANYETNGETDGEITINELKLYLSVRVKKLTGGKQTPTTVTPETIPDFPIAELN